ncbi:MAG: Gfo/Idh/MocA family protein, partial [Alphaproteobacteria bacterium]
LAALGADVAVVSRRPGEPGVETYADIASALAARRFDYAVVADETARHRTTLSVLRARGFAGPVLVEKPVFERTMPGDDAIQAPVFVGYNLRFHPLAQALRQWLDGKRAISAEIHVGQHLADWRPGRDHRTGYSANAAQGGGALRDLSHELDLALWLFGPLGRVAVLGGNSGALGTRADDHVLILAAFARCPAAAIALNALDRPARRAIHVTAAEGSATLDFIAGTLVAEGREIAHAAPERDFTYAAQHTALLGGGAPPLCTYAEGLAALRFVESVEQAQRDRLWVEAS